MFKNKIRSLVMKAINDRIDSAQQEYDKRCDEIDDNLLEDIERIRLEAKSNRKKVADELVRSIIH